MKRSIVIPVYNEAKRLPPTLRRLAEWAVSQVHETEILLVDDGSADRSCDLIRAAQAKHPAANFVLLRNETNHGKGYAVRQGMLEARGEICLFCDADLATPLEEIGRLAPLLGEADVVLGSRAMAASNVTQKQSAYRQLGGRGINLIIQLLAVPGIRDSQCGFKLFRREAARQIFERVTLDGFSFDVEVLFIARRLGLTVREAAISWADVEGSKVQPLQDALRLLRDLLIIRRNGWQGRYRDP